MITLSDDALALNLIILTASSNVYDFSGPPALDDKPSSKALCCAFCSLGMLKYLAIFFRKNCRSAPKI
jgi:hypothetical protein